MAIWLELRCEDRGNGRDEFRCWSDDNHGPAEMSSDDNASILETMKMLRAEAVENGWKRKKDGYVCPHCIAHAALKRTGSSAPTQQAIDAGKV